MHTTLSNEQMSDELLLRQLARGDRSAIGQIVARYIHFVHAAAMRQTQDPALAEDVAQSVFVLLWKKGAELRPDTILHSWLFTATRYASANAIRLRTRRRRHEQAAGEERARQGPTPATDEPLLPLLDEALSELGDTDRTAVLLSYFAQKGWREVGATIGLSEDAARKRVGRALLQLRSFFAGRGIATASCAVVGGALTRAASAQAPAYLTTSVTTCIAATVSTGAWIGMKYAAIWVISLLAALGGAGAMVMSRTAEPAAPREAGSLIAEMQNGVTVELIAISRRDQPGVWWKPDGTISSETFDPSDSTDDPPLTHQLALRVSSDAAVQPAWSLSGGSKGGWSGEPARRGGGPVADTWTMCFSPDPARPGSIDLRVKLATSPFQVLAAKQGIEGIFVTSDHGGVIINEVMEIGGQASVALSVGEPLMRLDRRIVALDHNGEEHQPTSRSMGSTGAVNLIVMKYDLLLNQVDQIQVQGREYDRYVEFKDVSIESGQKSRPTVQSGATTQPADQRR